METLEGVENTMNLEGYLCNLFFLLLLVKSFSSFLSNLFSKKFWPTKHQKFEKNFLDAKHTLSYLNLEP